MNFHPKRENELLLVTVFSTPPQETDKQLSRHEEPSIHFDGDESEFT
jgi:hypothetical protein